MVVKSHIFGAEGAEKFEVVENFWENVKSRSSLHVAILLEVFPLDLYLSL